MKKIAILGSTGSIGTQTLEIIRREGDIKVCALAAGQNIELLEKQIREFSPEIAAVFDKQKASELKAAIKDTGTKVYSGMEGLMAVASAEESSMLVTGIVGMIGIEPTIYAIKCGKDIALANKETLVCAGHIIMPLAQRMGVNILPVDSEHSAIFQCRQGNSFNRIKEIFLTASGGPFLHKPINELGTVSPEDALRHPTWAMGRKVTIDSSTMVNKGLEVLEASWLFHVPAERVKIVIHPESIVHSMVEYEDGAVIAQLGVADMKLPIAYALYYPKRVNFGENRLDFWNMKPIEMIKPDMEKFPAIKLAYEAGTLGGSLPTVFNAADEYAVSAFLEGKISYTDIEVCIRRAMEHHKDSGIIKAPTVEQIFEVKKDTEDYLRG